MSTYAIGDLQGCLEPFLRLLDLINFDPKKDRLWLTGDLINRGPQSLETLRKVVSLSDSVRCVLGNHDLALLAYAAGIKRHTNPDFEIILKAKDSDHLLSWLTNQPLIHADPTIGYLMVHAGLPPCWTQEQSIHYAGIAEQAIREKDFFATMYGDHPIKWSPSQSHEDNVRYTINAFTRMRFLDKDGGLDLQCKGEITKENESLAWFNAAIRQTDQYKIVFGHWAALNGYSPQPNIFAIDTGCVWGGHLSALCLETQRLNQVSSKITRSR